MRYERTAWIRIFILESDDKFKLLIYVSRIYLISIISQLLAMAQLPVDIKIPKIALVHLNQYVNFINFINLLYCQYLLEECVNKT